MNINNLKARVGQKRNQFRAKKDKNRHHRAHKKAAWRAINMVMELNGWELIEKNKRLADEYAIDVFGGKEYAPWLYFFTLFSGEFKEGWIPPNYYSMYVLPDPSLTRVSMVKTFSKTIFQTDALSDIGYFLNGRFYKKGFVPISLGELQDMVKENNRAVIVKRDNSLRGMNNHILGPDQITLETFQNIGDCVIQDLIEEHAFFKDIVDGPAATIRILTARNLMGEIEFRASWLKLGRKDQREYRSNMVVRVPVIDSFGALSSFCYGGSFQRLSAHPDTEVGFENKVIPRFVDAVAFCVGLHTKIPHFPIVGWDVTIDHENEIRLFEWNAGAPHPGIKTVQAAVGPCFSGLGWEDLWK